MSRQVPARGFQMRVLHTIRGESLIAPGSALVLAVSGGPDSMALLDVMHALGSRRDTRWRLSVAHLHHGIRGRSAERDLNVVRAAAEQRGLPFVAARADARTEAAKHKTSLEDAARRCRYAFLIDVARKAGAAVVATGHTADDQIETILHHLIRGTGLRGLTGMPIRRPLHVSQDSGLQRIETAAQPPSLVRPLLRCRRTDVLAYVASRGIAYCADPTNRDRRHTRNRIRRRLIPWLEREFNPGVGEALLRLSAQACDAAALIEALAARAVEASMQVSRGGAAVSMAYADYRAAPEAVKPEIVRLALRRLGAGLGEIGFERLTAAVATLGTPHGGRRIQLPGGVSIVRRGGRIWVERAK